MTITTEYTPDQYVGNGVTLVFAITFEFFATTDIVVEKTVISTGVTTDITSSIAVAGGSGTTGTVTFTAGSEPTSDERITISMDMPYVQEQDYVENTAFLAENVETNFDKAVVLARQAKESAERAISYSPTAAVTSNLIGQPVDAAVLKFNGITGEIIAGPTTTEIEDAEANATAAAASAASAESDADRAETAAALLPQNKYDATVDPTVNNDSSEGYSNGSQWLNATSGDTFQCSDATVGAANWVNTTTASLGSLAYKNTINNADWSGADLAVVNGGTGASTASAARTNLDVYSKAESEALSLQRLHLRYQVISGISGGSATGASYNDRPINTEVENTITGASLSSNQFVLPTGKYRIGVMGSCYVVGDNRLRLYNVTDAVAELLGLNCFCSPSNGQGTNAILNGNFEITSSKTFKVDHHVSNTKSTSGLGRPLTTGDDEVYLDIYIEKIGQ